MLKAITVAGTMAALIVGAASMATANNSSTLVSTEIRESGMAMANTHGIVDCASQEWPNIDAICLTAASEDGEVRQARLIGM